jgi:small subunit ribosomal protein S4
MARDTRSIVKMSRREGYALHPKAHKALVKRSSPPGQHGRNQSIKQSQYALQLREKQKLRGFTDCLNASFLIL